MADDNGELPPNPTPDQQPEATDAAAAETAENTTARLKRVRLSQESMQALQDWRAKAAANPEATLKEIMSGALDTQISDPVQRERVRRELEGTLSSQMGVKKDVAGSRPGPTESTTMSQSERRRQFGRDIDRSLNSYADQIRRGTPAEDVLKTVPEEFHEEILRRAQSQTSPDRANDEAAGRKQPTADQLRAARRGVPERAVGPNEAGQAEGQPKPPENFRPGEATWKNKDQDVPVKITGYLGKDADGKDYVSVEGNSTGVPLNEVVYPQPTSEQPEQPVAAGGAGGTKGPETPTATGAPGPEEPGEDETLRETIAAGRAEKVNLEDYAGVTEEDLRDELRDYSEAVRRLRDQNRRLDPNSEQYRRNERGIDAGRAKIRELQQVQKQLFGDKAKPSEGQPTLADYRRTETARTERISGYQTGDFDKLKSTMEELKNTRDMLAKRVDDLRDSGAPALQVEGARQAYDETNAQYQEAQTVYDARKPEEEKKKKEAEDKAAKEKREKEEAKVEELVGNKRPLEAVRKARDTAQANFNIIQTDFDALRNRLAVGGSEQDKARYGELLPQIKKAAEDLNAREQELASHPDAIIGRDIKYKLDVNAYIEGDAKKRGEILTAYGGTLEYTEIDLANIRQKIEAGETLNVREQAIYAREVSDILGGKKKGELNMSDLRRFCMDKNNKGLQESIWAQVAESEKVKKAFQEKYPSNWRKMLNFAKNHKGWMWIIMAVLVGGPLLTTGVISGAAGKVGSFV